MRKIEHKINELASYNKWTHNYLRYNFGFASQIEREGRR